jgi:hypothetical protein
MGRLAARDMEIRKLLIEIRHLLKPLSLLDDPSIVKRVKEEMETALQGSETTTSGLGRQMRPVGQSKACF